MPVTNSANMALPIPAVGTTAGPDYASDINACLTLVDSHDHSSGKGVQITPAGLNINSALSIGGNFLTSVAGVTLSAQGSAPAINTVYESGVDLYFKDGNGNAVRITQSGAVAGTPGSIANLVAPASASYVAGSSTFVWQSNTNIAANMDCGSILLRNLSPNSTYALTLNPPASMAADSAITLPTIPAVTSVVTIDSGGAMSTQPVVTLVPAGAILPYGGASAPSGYLLCDGTSYLRASYSALFSAISTAYGTADGTHFNVPDLRGMFIRGVSGATSNDPDRTSRTALNTGGNTGNNVGSYEGAAFASHNHNATDAGHIHAEKAIINAGGTDGPFYNAGGDGGSVTGTFTASGTANVTIANTGGNETRPINVYVQYIIKT